MLTRCCHALSRKPGRLALWFGCCALLLAVTPALADPFHPISLRRYATHRLTEPMLNLPGNDLSDLARGLDRKRPVKLLKEVPFRLEGAVMVGTKETERGLPGSPPIPQSVEGIRVGMKANRLYLLHGSHFAAEPGSRIGSYKVNYAGGAVEEIPIRSVTDVADWWDWGTEATEAPIAWIGRNEASTRGGRSIRLFLKTWNNPRPDVAIQSIDLMIGDQPPSPTAPAPFLVGLTVGHDHSDADRRR